MSVTEYDVGNGIVLRRNGDSLVLYDEGQSSDVAIPMVISQGDAMLLEDALNDARRDWHREQRRADEENKLQALVEGRGLPGEAQ